MAKQERLPPSCLSH